MLSKSIPTIRGQAVVTLSVLVISLWLAWEVGTEIVSGNMTSMMFFGLGLVACVVAVAILRNWRSGFYLFLGWLLFEDLARKYLGNGTALFFGKDILAALIYVSFAMTLLKGKQKTFQPLFLLPLLIFIWLAGIQIFNQNSPSIVYGLLGFKLYFYYVPLMYIGYALIRTDEDLQRFLVLNCIAAGLISLLGIVQAIVGSFHFRIRCS